MSRRSGRTPTPKRQDNSNVYYDDDELNDVFEDAFDDNDDDSDEDPDFEENPEEPSQDDTILEEEEQTIGLKRTIGSFSPNNPAFKRHCARNEWTLSPGTQQTTTTSLASGKVTAPNLQAFQYTGSSFSPRPAPLSSIAPPSYGSQSQNYYRSNANTEGNIPHRGYGSSPIQGQNNYSNQGYPSGYRPSHQNPTSNPNSNPNSMQQPYNYGQATTFSRQLSNAVNPTRYGHGAGGATGAPGAPGAPGAHPQQPNGVPGAQNVNAVTTQAEWQVRNLLMEHHKRTKQEGIPHEISLNQLKREISGHPELIEALRNIRQRALQQRLQQQQQRLQQQQQQFQNDGRPGGTYPTGDKSGYPVNFQNPNYQGHGAGMREPTNPYYNPQGKPGSVPDYHSNNYPMPYQQQQPGYRQQPAQQYQSSYPQQPNQPNQQSNQPQYLPHQQDQSQYSSQYRNQITSRPPLIKQVLNAKMATSLMNQTAAAPPDNALDAIKAPVEEEQPVETEDFSNLSENDRKIETVMRKCEAISRQLRESLQKHLKSLLSEDKEKKDTEVKDEEGSNEKDEKSVEKESEDLGSLDPSASESFFADWCSTLETKEEIKSEATTEAVTPTPKIGEDSKEQKDVKTEETKEPDSNKDGEGDDEASDKTKSDYYIVREQPNILQYALKEYQLVGLNWLNLLHLEKVNGILADEMGLGKTIQTISLFALLHERKTAQHPHIVICPATTLTNWMRELQKWCPVLNVIAYYGTKAERDLAKRYISQNHFDVILTTYNTAAQKSDRLFLKKIRFDYVVLDEAQNIKNNQSLRHKYLAKLQSCNRLLLTGTPLQNNLEELWALLQFIMPDLFASQIELEAEADSEQAEKRVTRMKVIMAPFVLRRLKQHVSQDLPQKECKVIECPMTEFQIELYNNCVQQSKTWWQKNQVELAGGDEEEVEIIDEDEPPIDSPVESVDPVEDESDESDAESKSSKNKKDTKAGAKISPNASEIDGGDKNISNGATTKEKKNGTAKEEKNGNSKRVTRSTTASDDVPGNTLEAPDSFSQRSSPVSSMNNIFMQLRKIANHPLLVRAYYTNDQIMEIAQYLSTLDDYRKSTVDRIFSDISEYSDFRIHKLCTDKPALQQFLLKNEYLECCGKALKLKETLRELRQCGHRVLLFSQMTRVLSILEDLITLWGYNYVRLDGNTPVAQRQILIDRFNDERDTLFVFLLSTRAGGVGINLTSADTVIFYDIAFNPQVDRQAEDRCHRLGQEKPVTIYKMISTESVDEHMSRMAERKAQLNDVMLEEGSKKKEKTKVWAIRSMLSSVFE